MPHPPSKPGLPRLTQARVGLTREIEVQDELGQRRRLHIPCERPLTVFVDKRELITLMTLGLAPELLVLGWLRNQGLIRAAQEIESITVDWEVGAAAVRSHAGLSEAWAQQSAKRTLTTGCGQGTVFGDMMAGLEGLALPPPTQARLSRSALCAQLEQMRAQDSVYKQAGSVHGCALFEGERLLVMVEDVGRHNALDSIAGWLWMTHAGGLHAPVLYTTGRISSEMVLKAAWMGVPIIVSRNGITQMGLDLALQLGLCLIGRARGRHFIVYSGFERFDATL